MADGVGEGGCRCSSTDKEDVDDIIDSGWKHGSSLPGLSKTIQEETTDGGDGGGVKMDAFNE